jgi:hypothetical protein
MPWSAIEVQTHSRDRAAFGSVGGHNISCGANIIVLGKHSFLGPIDPQILVQTPLGARYAPAQAIIEQFEKAVEECQNPKRLPAWIPMLSQYGPDLLVACDNASELSKTLVADWLRRWMFGNARDKTQRADKIAAWLANHSQFKSHGRHIGRSLLRRKGLQIQNLEEDQALQDSVLSIFHATTHTFGGTLAGKIIENHLGKAFVKVFQTPVMQIAQAIPQQPPPQP